MLKRSNSLLSPGSACSGALWGAGVFLFLWLGMFGTIGEMLLLLPALWLLGLLGVVTPGESQLWRVIAAVLSGAGFSFIGAKCSPIVSLAYERLPRAIFVIVIVFSVVIALMIVLIGRHLTT